MSPEGILAAVVLIAFAALLGGVFERAEDLPSAFPEEEGRPTVIVVAPPSLPAPAAQRVDHYHHLVEPTSRRIEPAHVPQLTEQARRLVESGLADPLE